MESDAYATGQTLYVLARAGVNPEAACLERGVAFLTRTQLPDGAWPMTSRVNAKNLTPIKGAGTAWAVLGLLRVSPRDSHGMASPSAARPLVRIHECDGLRLCVVGQLDS